MSEPPLVIIGHGPAGRSALQAAPQARLLSRPADTVWHAEPGRLWVESASGVWACAFSRFLLCADEPLLLMALGCAFADGRPVVDRSGQTTVAGIFAAGRILGAATAQEAARQGGIAGAALCGRAPDGEIGPLPPLPVPPLADPAPAARLDPLDIALLLEQEPGPERNRAALAQAAARGPRLSGMLAPSRPVGLAALAAIAPVALEDREAQHDAGWLS